MHHLVDPERMFSSAGCLLGVLADDDLDGRWKLLVLEDCDELVRGDARPVPASRSPASST